MCIVISILLMNFCSTWVNFTFVTILTSNYNCFIFYIGVGGIRNLNVKFEKTFTWKRKQSKKISIVCTCVYLFQDIDQYLANEAKKDGELENVRLENIKLKNKLKKKELQLKSKVHELTTFFFVFPFCFFLI